MTKLGLEFTEQEYAHGRRVRINVIEGGIPYSTMTINIPQAQLDDNEFIMNATHSKYCQGINKILTEKGYISNTGKVCTAGFQTYQIWTRHKSLNNLFL